MTPANENEPAGHGRSAANPSPPGLEAGSWIVASMKIHSYEFGI